MKSRTVLRQSAAAILGLTVCLSTLPAFALSIKVLNGSRTAGRAAQVGAFLKKKGFPVSKVDKADKIFDSTVIYYKDGARDDAKKIADLMPATQSIKPLSWESQFDLIIVVGNDQASAEAPAESTLITEETHAPASAAGGATGEGAGSAESANGGVTATPPATAEPEVPEVEGESGAPAPAPGAQPEAAGVEGSAPAESKAVEPSPAPKPKAKPAPAAKPAAVTKAKAPKPSSASPKPAAAGKSAAKPGAVEPKPAPAPAGYIEVAVADLMKQVGEHIGKSVRIQDEFMDQSNYFLGVKDLGIGPEEYVEFFSGENRVNLIVYVLKSNRDAVATLNAFKRGDKVVVHGKVIAKNPIGRPLLMADRLDRG